MDAAKKYEWAKYIGEAGLIGDKTARESEILKRLLKLKTQMAKLYGSDESKWRHIYLAIKEMAAQEEVKYKRAALTQAQVRAAVIAPIYASAMMGRPLSSTEAAMTSRAALYGATKTMANKYKKGRRNHSRKRRNTRKNGGK